MQMSPTNSHQDWLPERIGHYKILEILGMGGMGVIYRAVQESLNRVVALKVLPPQFLNDNESSLRFETEAKAISMLQHQNIVQMYEYGEENGCRYFTMQYIDGNNLSQRIAVKKPMLISEVVDFSRQICRGLRYAHGMNVIHRDIKPQNVLIDKQGIARLSDFGIAKLVSQDDITMTGVTVGTPEYMSPEQAAGKDLTIQTDIYSLGILIYEMLTRRPPFTANNPVAVAYKQVHEIPAPPSVHRRDIPKRLELIVLKALKKEVKNRYQTVDEMLDNLDSVDVNEKVERTTALFRVPSGKYAGEIEEKERFSEKRITDRRGESNRRKRSAYGGEFPFWSRGYWAEMFQYNWLPLTLVLMLYLIVLFHIIVYH